MIVTPPARAELKPSEIAIVVARGSRESQRLAEYYAQQRAVPTGNICPVDMPEGETISREEWTWAVRPEIRKWLAENDPERKLRCLVTTWDVPLRIAGDKPDATKTQLAGYREFLAGERQKRLALVDQLIGQYGELAGGDASSTTPADASAEQGDLDALQQRIEQELQAAQTRVRDLPDETERQQAAAKLQQLTAAIGGVQVLYQSLVRRDSGGDDQSLQPETERLRGMLMAQAQTQQTLDREPPGIRRDYLLLNTITQGQGLLASVRWLDEQIKLVDKGETRASFDSELSLVLWPDGYQLLRWQPNYLRPEYDNSQLREAFPTLMVSRLDGPTLLVTKRIVDDSIRVEKEGLAGKVYLDARGIGKLDGPRPKPGSYADYDRALLQTDQGLRESTTLDVTLNTESELFQPGDAPDAALYCGWYSLGKYVDAFDFNPGAVAYHMASGEATTLRQADSQVWCKRLLEDGVAATMGPVYEPYLAAFPRPDEFFALLLGGDLTLVECYYRTKSFNSWQMTLIGDPLYRPFAARDVRK